jgi:hypothetical protein
MTGIGEAPKEWGANSEQLSDSQQSGESGKANVESSGNCCREDVWESNEGVADNPSGEECCQDSVPFMRMCAT